MTFESRPLGMDLFHDSLDTVWVIQGKLRETHSRQKFFVNCRLQSLELLGTGVTLNTSHEGYSKIQEEGQAQPQVYWIVQDSIVGS